MEIGTISLLTRVGEWVYRAVLKIREKIHDTVEHVSYESLPATVSDLPGLHEMFRKQFGDDAPKIEKMFEWDKAHPEQLFKVVKSRHKRFSTDHTVVGAFKVLRANQIAATLLDQERLSGTSFESGHIARRGERPFAIYIGDVLGVSAVAQGQVMHFLITYLQTESDAGVRYFYSRPLSARGLSWTMQNGFVAVNQRYHGQLNHIYKRDNWTEGSLPTAQRSGKVPKGQSQRTKRRAASASRGA